MIKFEAVQFLEFKVGSQENRIAFSALRCDGYLYLTPKKTLDSIKELQKGLFVWHELIGEPVDKPECH